MTEELNRKADRLSLAYKTKYSEDRTLKDMLSRPQAFVEGAVEGIINLLRQKAYRDGYIAGATENGLQWHDLRKNPDDLPDSNRTVFAVARVGGNRQYPYLAQYWNGSKVEWCCWRNNMQRELVEPDAWCEIPTFEE